MTWVSAASWWHVSSRRFSAVDPLVGRSGGGGGRFALLWWADRCLGQNLSISLRIRDHHTLVTEGPYRSVRHPIYTATLVYAAALAIVTANYLLAVAIFVPMALAGDAATSVDVRNR